MKKQLLALSTLGLLLITTGCNTDLSYKTKFDSVNVNNQSYAISQGKYQGKVIDIEAKHTSSMEITLTNNSNEPITVLWERSSFVDPLGERHAVAHGHKRCASQKMLEPITVIEPGKTVRDTVTNADNINHNDKYYAELDLESPRNSTLGAWRDQGLIKSRFAPVEGNPTSIANQFVGKSMTLDLAIEANGTEDHYELNFEVQGYHYGGKDITVETLEASA